MIEILKIFLTKTDIFNGKDDFMKLLKIDDKIDTKLVYFWYLDKFMKE